MLNKTPLNLPPVIKAQIRASAKAMHAEPQQTEDLKITGLAAKVLTRIRVWRIRLASKLQALSSEQWRRIYSDSGLVLVSMESSWSPHSGMILRMNVRGPELDRDPS